MKITIVNELTRDERVEEFYGSKFLGEILDISESNAIRDHLLDPCDEQNRLLDFSTLFSADAKIVLKKARFHGTIIFNIKDLLPDKQ